MTDFVYNKKAHDLESSLEDIMDSHQAEDAASTPSAPTSDLGGDEVKTSSSLERIAGPLTLDQIEASVRSSLAGAKTAAEITHEDDVRELIRSKTASKRSLVDRFLASNRPLG